MSSPAPKTSSPAPTRLATPPSLGWMLLLAAALFALMLPIIGPLDDHHFAERTHTHEHIYLNGHPVAHGHAYGAGLEHRHPVSNLLPPGSDAPPSGDGVVLLTPATAGLMLAVLSAPYHTAPDALRPPAPRAGNANPLARFAEPSRQPDEAITSPPERPPIV